MTLRPINHMTHEQFRQEAGLDPVAVPESSAAGASKKPNKWKNKPEWYESPMVGLRRYDSQKEARRARQIDLEVSAGNIVAWWHQWPIWCGFDDEKGTPVRMYPDFRIMWANGLVTYEDVKGAAPTTDWKLKANAVRELHGITVKIV